MSKFRYLRLSSFGVDTEDARTAERYRLAWLGAIATITSRLAAMGIMVLTVRWAAPVLGTERFGVWATFSSLVAMLSFLDLGVGNALINQVARACASGDVKRISSIVSGGVGWLIGIGFFSAAALAILSSMIPWIRFFHLSSVSVGHEAQAGALVFSALFGINLLATGQLKILVGQQKSYEAQAIGTVSTLLSAFTVWYCIKHDPTIATLLGAGFGVQSVMPLVFSTTILRMRRMIRFRDVASSMSEHRKSILTSGSFYLTLQVGTMIGWGSDSLLIAGFSGATDVAEFAVVQRLFQFASQPGAVINSTLWPAYADAHARGDVVFLKATLRRSLFFSVAIATSMSTILLFTGPSLIPYWTKSSIPVTWLLLLAFAAWTCIESAGSAFAMYLNGVGIVKIQILVVTIFCAVALPAKIWGIIHFGSTGLVAATSASYLLTVYVLYGIVFRKKILKPITQ